ncbi:hypothetical protein ES708_19504 [subsurface metagenome]
MQIKSIEGKITIKADCKYWGEVKYRFLTVPGCELKYRYWCKFGCLTCKDYKKKED